MKKRRTQKWRQTVKLATPLTVVCGIVAVGYFFYRAALITVPAVSFEQRLLNPVARACNEEDAPLKDIAPVLSRSYQGRIASLISESNMVTNPDLSEIDPDLNEPVGYIHNLDMDTAAFEYLRSSTDKKLFLRVTNTNEADADTPSWLPSFVPIEDERTYAYGFSYRSNVPVDVSLEYMTADGELHYQSVMTAQPANPWQSFMAHFRNIEDVTMLRVVLSGKNKGFVDSRDFTISRIPDAALDAGIVSVTFDDGWQSVKTEALPLLDRYRIRTTQYIISEVADHASSEYMNFDTISDLKKGGHEIGSHSLLHCNQTSLEQGLMRENAIESKAKLEQRNLGPIRSFAYPLGQYDEITQSIFTREYPLVRTSDFGYNDRYFDETNIRSIGIVDTTSDEEFRSWLQHAKVHRLWIVIVYHRTNESGEYNVTTGQMERQFKMVADSGLKIIPLGEAADSIRK